MAPERMLEKTANRWPEFVGWPAGLLLLVLLVLLLLTPGALSNATSDGSYDTAGQVIAKFNLLILFCLGLAVLVSLALFCFKYLADRQQASRIARGHRVSDLHRNFVFLVALVLCLLLGVAVPRALYWGLESIVASAGFPLAGLTLTPYGGAALGLVLFGLSWVIWFVANWVFRRMAMSRVQKITQSLNLEPLRR